ncbi:MAG: prepilin-type N-terminal cleavage/methylation domain-containing protein [Bdellovibrionota bacterium]
MIKDKHGFTLIELMVSFLIVGVLVSNALSTSSNYKKKARVVEGITSIKTIQDLQRVHYLENDYFLNAGSGTVDDYMLIMNNGVAPYRPTYESLAERTDDQYSSTYEQLGEVFAPGQNLHFFYRSIAASFDESGNIISNLGPRHPAIGFGNLNVDGGTCTDTMDNRPDVGLLGIKEYPTHKYNWSVVWATTNLSVLDSSTYNRSALRISGDTCTSLIAYMIYDSTPGEKPFQQSSIIKVGSIE